MRAHVQHVAKEDFCIYNVYLSILVILFMALLISVAVEKKLSDKHRVTRREVEQCFENREGGFLKDTRERHRTDPPTLWFIALTNKNRELKIVFMQNGNDIHLKSAFEPNDQECKIYRLKTR